MDWRSLSSEDVRGIVLVAVLLVAVFCILVFYPDAGAKHNYGFGPEWECKPMQQGDPICVKRSP
jgi:hypothetical protein